MDTAHTIRWVQRQELNLQTLAYETSEQPLLNAEWLRVLDLNQRMSQSKCDAFYRLANPQYNADKLSFTDAL